MAGWASFSGMTRAWAALLGVFRISAWSSRWFAMVGLSGCLPNLLGGRGLSVVLCAAPPSSGRPDGALGVNWGSGGAWGFGVMGAADGGLGGGARFGRRHERAPATDSGSVGLLAWRRSLDVVRAGHRRGRPVEWGGQVGWCSPGHLTNLAICTGLRAKSDQLPDHWLVCRSRVDV